MDILLKSRQYPSQLCSCKGPKYTPFIKVIGMECARQRDTSIIVQLVQWCTLKAKVGGRRYCYKNRDSRKSYNTSPSKGKWAQLL